MVFHQVFFRENPQISGETKAFSSMEGKRTCMRLNCQNEAGQYLSTCEVHLAESRMRNKESRRRKREKMQTTQPVSSEPFVEALCVQPACSNLTSAEHKYCSLHRPCLTRGCRAPVALGKARCQRHIEMQREYNKDYHQAKKRNRPVISVENHLHVHLHQSPQSTV